MATILLPAVHGRIDHLNCDTNHQRVFIAALGNNSVEVVDLTLKRVIHSIKNLHEPQGVVYISDNRSLFITNGGNGECDIFDTDSFTLKTSLRLSGDADNVRYDAKDKKIYVGYGDGGLAVIDATTFKIISKLELPGHPESFQLAPSEHKIFVNIPSRNEIAVVDLSNLTLTDSWPVTGAAANFPMAIDEAGQRLFIGCRHPARLQVLDSRAGTPVASYTIDQDADDIFYNPESKEIYVSCGRGRIDVFKQSGKDGYSAAGILTTSSGSRTSLFIPELKQLIVASPERPGSSARLFVYSVN